MKKELHNIDIIDLAVKTNRKLALEDVKTFVQANPLDIATQAIIFDVALYWFGHAQLKGNPEKFSTVQENEYYNILHFIKNNINIDINKKWEGSGKQLDNGNTVLMRFISAGRDLVDQSSILMFLNEYNADPFVFNDRDRKNALHFLLLKGHRVQQCVIDACLKHAAIREHINDPTIYGDTALHIACARRDRANIAHLLKHGAVTSLDVVNKIGQKPVDMLHMSESERSKYLLLYLDYLLLYLNEDGIFSNVQDLVGYIQSPMEDREKKHLNHVSTIEDEVFNSDPVVIENYINNYFLKSKITL